MKDFHKRTSDLIHLGLKSYFPYLLGNKSDVEIPSEEIQKIGDFANVSYDRTPPQQIEGFGEINSYLTDDDIKTYVDNQNKVVNLSIRGTDLLDKERRKRDLPEDFKLGLGLSGGERSFDAEKRVELVKKKYPDFEVKTYGFSLGGSISRDVSRKYPDVKSISINPASGLQEIIREEPKYSKVYRVKGDLFSRGVKTSNQSVQLYDPSVIPYYSHGLANISLKK